VTTASGLLSAPPAPDVAKRTWPWYLALGVGLVVLGVVAALWPAGGARLLLTAVGVFLAVRGAALLRAGVRGPGAGALVLGLLAVGAAPLPVAGSVLLVAVPVLLLGTALALVTRGGTARRGGLALLVWTVLVTGVLVATGLGQDWDRAADVARLAAAFAVAVLGVPVLLAAASLRSVAAQPPPAPARPAACAGCACSAGGCGAG
jgi:hypothetical protein